MGHSHDHVQIHRVQMFKVEYCAQLTTNYHHCTTTVSLLPPPPTSIGSHKHCSPALSSVNGEPCGCKIATSQWQQLLVCIEAPKALQHKVNKFFQCYFLSFSSYIGLIQFFLDYLLPQVLIKYETPPRQWQDRVTGPITDKATPTPTATSLCL
jgi:hypothetical protein